MHGNLEPRNILINEASGYLTVTDYGTARFITRGFDMELSNHIIQNYRSPEICHTDGDEYNEMADWWSLGCIAYELVWGKKAFVPIPEAYHLAEHMKRPENVRLFEAITKDEPDYPQIGGRHLYDCKDFIEKLLMKDPA